MSKEIAKYAFWGIFISACFGGLVEKGGTALALCAIALVLKEKL